MLSKEQCMHAALDVIKLLQAYKRMSSLPNLAQRLNPTQAIAGFPVDVVPPHDRGQRKRLTRGFCMADIATRAAIGSLLGNDRTVNPAGITPSHVTSDQSACSCPLCPWSLCGKHWWSENTYTW
jgi:hypothetical protein